jgi:hypothetical protein
MSVYPIKRDSFTFTPREIRLNKLGNYTRISKQYTVMDLTRSLSISDNRPL